MNKRIQTPEFINGVKANLMDGEKDVVIEQVIRRVRATLQTLGECLPAALGAKLADRLPKELSDCLALYPYHGDMTLPNFFLLSAKRGSMSVTQAIHHARAVFVMLQTVLPGDVMAELQQRLPTEFNPLFDIKKRFGEGVE